MKKKQLIITDSLKDTILLGIISALKAYKLAWLINKTTTLQLTKVEDLRFETLAHSVSYTTRFLFATEHCTCRLIKNRSVTDREETINYLVPRLKHIDFFFSVQDFTQTFDAGAFCSKLAATNKITYIASLDLRMYKDKAHLFFN